MKVLDKKANKPPVQIPLAAGDKIRDYEVIKVLGMGGFSVVYAAMEPEGNNVVAIKEYYAPNCMRRKRDGSLGIHPKDAEKKYKHGLKRFFDEGFTLSQMHHHNIVPVKNFFREKNTAYLVMDFQPGKDLRWFIKNTDVSPSESFLLSVFSMVLAGLKEVHKKGYLHLDIKPSNILLRASGDPLILDLGAAFELDEKRIPKLQTLTHGYSSPEQHERRPLSYASDLYSIGMAMRACITHATPLSAVKRRKKDTVQPLVETHVDRYRRQFLLTIDAACNMNHDRRPQTTDESISRLTAK